MTESAVPARHSHPGGRAPWLAAYATGAAEALATALHLLDGDDVTTRPTGHGFVLQVLADPPRAVQALAWSAHAGWSYSTDPPWRRAPRWFPLPVPGDADALTVAEVLGAVVAHR